MKLVRNLCQPWLVKIILFFAFLTSLGVWAWIGGWSKDDLPKAEQEKRIKILRDFADNRLKIAQEGWAYGIGYTPEEYFEDLHAVEAKAAELKVPYNMVFNNFFIHMRQHAGYSYTWKEMDTASRKFSEFHEKYETRYIETRIDWAKTLSEYGSWLWLSYLKNMPIAFIYLLLKLKEWQKEKTGRFKSVKPLRFLLMVIWYPIVILGLIRGWYIRQSRRLIREAGLRQTRDKLFTFLSIEEREFIEKSISSRLSFAEWRNRLRALGLKPKHSFAAALTVTLLLELIPRIAFAGGKEMFVAKPSVGVAVECSKLVGNNLPRMGVCDSDHDWNWSEEGERFLPEVWLKPDEGKNCLPVNTVKPLTVKLKIDHVPRTASQFLKSRQISLN